MGRILGRSAAWRAALRSLLALVSTPVLSSFAIRHGRFPGLSSGGTRRSRVVGSTHRSNFPLATICTLAGLALCTPLATQAQAPDAGTESRVYTFTGGTTDGYFSSTLLMNSDGTLYGTSDVSSATHIFQLTTAGVFTVKGEICFQVACSLYTEPYVGGTPSGLIPDGTGNFYGFINNGGGGANSGFYQLTPSGTINSIYDYPNPSLPQGGSEGGVEYLVTFVGSPLIFGSDGNFYGISGANTESASVAPNGGIYKLTPAGVYTLLYAFSAPNAGTGGNTGVDPQNSDGYNPEGPLVEGNDGNYYGTTLFGGTGSGTIFKITPGGTFSVLYTFTSDPGTNTDGAHPEGGLVVGANGNFYGTTDEGGLYGAGTIFEITPGGTFTVLHAFGSTPTAALSLGANPTSITQGQSTTLSWSFTGADSYYEGGFPIGQLVAGLDGNLYGVIGSLFDPGRSGGQYGDGMAYQLTPSGVFTILYSFGGTSSDAEFPYSLIQASDGTFYGTAGQASNVTNSPGAIFSLTVAPSTATPCTASGAWSGTQAASGSTSQTPTGTGNITYTLTCTYSTGANNTGTLSKSVTVAVTAAPAPTVTISANPTSLVLGQSTLLTWSSTNATSCTASNAWTGPEATSGTLSVTPATTGTVSYTLTCTGAGGSASNTASVNVTLPAPTVTIAANPSSIDLGSSTTLTWSSTNAGSCSASGAWHGAQPPSGTTGETPTVTGTNSYTLTCNGPGGTASNTASVNVIAPPTVTISASPASIALGSTSTLTWSSTNATSCTASGAWTGSEATSGSLSVKPSATGTSSYMLTCTGAGGSASNSASVTVSAAPSPPAPTVSIAVSPTSITLGQSATLTWSSTNATACTASGAWSGSQATSSTGTTETPSATGSYTYTLSCTGTGGSSAPASATLTVNAAPPPPAPTVTIAISPASIILGQSASLTWSSTNATACTASGAWSGSEATSGSNTETPSATGSYSYTLSCTGSGGNASASAGLTVSAVPPPPVNNGITGSAGGGFGPGVLAVLGGLAALRRRKRLPLAALLCGAVLSAAVLPAPAQAQQLAFDTQHAYVGLKVGEGIYGLTSGEFSAQLAAKGDNVSGVSLDQHRVAGGIYGGIPFWAGLAVEAGFVDLGKYEVSLDSTSSLSKVTGDVTHALRPAGQGLTLGLGGALPLADRFFLQPHVAMLIYDSTQQANSAVGTLKAHKAGIGGAFGLSAFYRLAGGLNAGLGFDAYVQGGGTSVYLPSAQIEYRFGP